MFGNMGFGGMGGGGGFESAYAGMMPQTKSKIWAEECFIAEFCDHFAGNVMRGNDIIRCTQYFSDILEYLLQEVAKGGGIPSEVGEKITGPMRRLLGFFEKAEAMFRKIQTWSQWHLGWHMSKIIDDMTKLINGMNPGDMCVFPLFLPTVTGIVIVQPNPKRQSHCIVTLINPSPLTNYHPKKVDPTDPSKIKQQIALTLSDIPKSKLCSEAFWTCVYVGSTKLTEESVFYTHFCEWLTGLTFDQQIAEHQVEATYSTPAKSSETCFWKSIVHTLKFFLRKEGLSHSEVRHVRHYIKMFMLDLVEVDLKTVNSVKNSTKLLIQSAAQSAAISLARTSTQLSEEAFQAGKKRIIDLETIVNNKPCDDDGVTQDPPLLDISSGWDSAQQPDSYPLWETMRRIEGVDQFAGAKVEQAKSSPINFLELSEQITTVESALYTLQRMSLILVRLAAQAQRQGVVKNPIQLAVSWIGHYFCEVFLCRLARSLEAKERSASGQPR